MKEMFSEWNSEGNIKMREKLRFEQCWSRLQGDSDLNVEAKAEPGNVS